MTFCMSWLPCNVLKLGTTQVTWKSHVTLLVEQRSSLTFFNLRMYVLNWMAGPLTRSHLMKNVTLRMTI